MNADKFATFNSLIAAEISNNILDTYIFSDETDEEKAVIALDKSVVLHTLGIMKVRHANFINISVDDLAMRYIWSIKDFIRAADENFAADMTMDDKIIIVMDEIAKEVQNSILFSFFIDTLYHEGMFDASEEQSEKLDG